MMERARDIFLSPLVKPILGLKPNIGFGGSNFLSSNIVGLRARSPSSTEKAYKQALVQGKQRFPENKLSYILYFTH